MHQISEVSVFIPKQQIQELGVNFLDVLKKISPEDLLRKQQAIALIASRLQYSNVTTAHTDHALLEIVTLQFRSIDSWMDNCYALFCMMLWCSSQLGSGMEAMDEPGNPLLETPWMSLLVPYLPHLTLPHLTSPHPTSPHPTSPHPTSPYPTSPHLSVVARR